MIEEADTGHLASPAGDETAVKLGMERSDGHTWAASAKDPSTLTALLLTCMLGLFGHHLRRRQTI